MFLFVILEYTKFPVITTYTVLSVETFSFPIFNNTLDFGRKFIKCSKFFSMFSIIYHIVNTYICSMCFYLNFLKILFIYFLRQGIGRRKRGRETSVCGCLLCALYWGPDLQPRHVPWLGIEPVTLCFTGPHSIHWATPARAIQCAKLTKYGNL